MAKRLKILIVEDVATDAELIEYELRRAGIAFASACVDDEDGFLSALHTFRPDVIISDYSMPQFDGMTVLQLAEQRAPNVPVIVATGPLNEETALRCMQAGAVDYVLKDRLVRIGPAVRNALEVKRTRKEKKEAQDALRLVHHELRLARRIQQGLLPKSAPTLKGFDISGRSIPAEATGGDYYDYVAMRDGALVLAIGDASGHGIGPAILSAMTRAYLRALAQTHDQVGDILSLANRLLVEDTVSEHFVALLLARIDPATRRLVYANAGHEAACVLDRAGNVKAKLESTGFPLGWYAETEFPSGAEIALEPGDMVLFCTDGCAEAVSPSHEIYGGERVLDVVRRRRHGAAAEIVDDLFDDLKTFAGGQHFRDDATVVVVKVDED